MRTCQERKHHGTKGMIHKFRFCAAIGPTDMTLNVPAPPSHASSNLDSPGPRSSFRRRHLNAFNCATATFCTPSVRKRRGTQLIYAHLTSFLVLSCRQPYAHTRRHWWSLIAVSEMMNVLSRLEFNSFSSEHSVNTIVKRRVISFYPSVWGAGCCLARPQYTCKVKSVVARCKLYRLRCK